MFCFCVRQGGNLFFKDKNGKLTQVSPDQFHADTRKNGRVCMQTTCASTWGRTTGRFSFLNVARAWFPWEALLVHKGSDCCHHIRPVQFEQRHNSNKSTNFLLTLKAVWLHVRVLCETEGTETIGAIITELGSRRPACSRPQHVL